MNDEDFQDRFAVEAEHRAQWSESGWVPTDFFYEATGMEDVSSGAGSKGLAWHYAPPTALLGILQNNVVWAGSAALMNDYKELRIGATALRSHITSQEGMLGSHVVSQFLDAVSGNDNARAHQRFILSGSSDGDNLTLFRNYGGQMVSYAVGFDTSIRLVPLQQRTSPPGASGNVAVPGTAIEIDERGFSRLAFSPVQIHTATRSWRSVVYDRDQTSKLVERAFNLLHYDYVQLLAAPDHVRPHLTLGNYDIRLEALDFIKSTSFQDERELRIMIPIARPSWMFVRFRPGSLGVLPYIELTSPDSPNGYAKKATKLPIRHIRISPTPYPEEAQASLTQLLADHGYEDVEVSVSDIPFR